MCALRVNSFGYDPITGEAVLRSAVPGERTQQTSPTGRLSVAAGEAGVRATLAGPRGRSRQAHSGWTAAFVTFCVAYLLAACGLMAVIVVDLAR